MVKKRKTKLPKTLNLFGYKIDYQDYVERFLPEHDGWMKKIFKKIDIEWDYELTTKQKSKYWDCRNIYPKSIGDFKKKFFNKRKPKGIEGVWGLDVMGKSARLGIVKDGDVYQYYYIDVWWKFKQHTGSFFKNVFNHPGESDYSVLNGTKFGVITPDKKNPRKFKVKGISTTISSLRKEESLPMNYQVEYELYLQSGGRELLNESEVSKKLFESSFGEMNKTSYKIWPEYIIPKKERWTTKGPGEKGYIEEQNRRLKEEKNENEKAGSFGSGFFVTDKGHIITNYHVVNGSKNIKFLYKDEEVDAKLVASDKQLDLALLKSKVENKSYIKFSNKSPQKAQNILVAGFPFGKAISSDLKITGGIINSLKGGGNDTTRLQIDATVNPGNSGGPIVDKLNGSLVGVAVSKLNKDFTKEVFGAEGENTNYGIKASQVRDFLESNNINVSIKSSKLKISELEGSTVFIYNK